MGLIPFARPSFAGWACYVDAIYMLTFFGKNMAHLIWVILSVILSMRYKIDLSQSITESLVLFTDPKCRVFLRLDFCENLQQRSKNQGNPWPKTNGFLSPPEDRSAMTDAELISKSSSCRSMVEARELGRLSTEP